MTVPTTRPAAGPPQVPDAVPRGVRFGAAGAAGVLVAVTLLSRSATDPVPLAVDVALGAAACVLVAVLPSRPVPVALALAVLAAICPAVTPAATLATLVVAQLRPLPVAVAVGAAGLLGHAAQGLVRPPGGLPYGWWLVLAVVAHAALVAGGAYLRARRELLASLRRRAHRAETEQAARVAGARAAERTAIAREMHDVLAHRLSLVAATAGALEYRPDSSPQQVARAAGVVREGVHLALEELREVIGVLRADGEAADRPPPRLGDVGELVEESRRAGTDVRLRDDVTGPDTPPGTALPGTALPDAVARTAYRVVQEGLTNARRHAPGRTVHVHLGGAPGTELVVELRNAAAEPPTEGLPSSGTGLVGLAERAALAGGTLTHGTGATGEFHLRARLPWPR